jgi:hypothetical protein
MNFGRQLVVCALASALLLGSGCEKKKPQLPAQAKAPAEPVATPLPSEISETVPPPPPPQPTPQPPPPEPPPVKAQKHRSKSKKVTTATIPPASLQAATPSPTTSAPSNDTVAAAHPPANPAATPSPDLAIAPDVSNDQLARQKQSTAQLLEETEKSISGLKGLTHEEEETLSQVRLYLNQSRKATSDGDFERAYNLATKAHLLSDALVKK